jgi:cytochrome c peroxidase
MRGTDDVVIYEANNDHVPFAPLGRIEAGCVQPEGLAIDRHGRTLWIHCPSDQTVTQVDVQLVRRQLSETKDRTLRTTGRTPLPGSPLPEAVRTGRRLFRSAGPVMSRRGAWSCSTCHPEGGSDGVVWPLTEGLRNTPSLARPLAATAPFEWRGGAATLSEAVDRQWARMGGAGPTPEDQAALTAWIDDGIEPPFPGFVPFDEQYLAIVEGKGIFDSPNQECATCHPAPTFTDGLPHDVTGDEEMITPSLLGVRRSAPYYHDGRLHDLPEVLRKAGRLHGNTSNLSQPALTKLIAYLESL